MKICKLIALLFITIVLVGCGQKKDKKLSSEESLLGNANGGGGIKREGKILTFGEFGVTVKRRNIQDVLGLKELEDGINILTLPENIKGRIQMAINPLGKRKYYDINENDIGMEQQRLIIKKYQSAIRENIPKKHLKILALTIGNETFILPDFYKLKDNIARAAILFHEAIWVINPKLDYKVVIGAEIAFENFLRTNLNVNKVAYDSDLLQALKLTFNDPYIGITTAANYEFYDQKTREYINTDGNKIEVIDANFPISFILGDLAIHNLVNHPNLNKHLVYENLFRLYKLNPGSVIIRELLIESLGMDSNLVLKVHSYDSYRGEYISYVISAQSYEERFRVGSDYFTLPLTFWDGKIGNETFDLKFPFFIDKWASPIGFKGRNGTIGLESRPQDGKIFYKKNESIALFVKGVQVELPTVILQDSEKCEIVIYSSNGLGVSVRPVQSRDEGENYKPRNTEDYKEYHHYTRCYQKW